MYLIPAYYTAKCFECKLCFRILRRVLIFEMKAEIQKPEPSHNEIHRHEIWEKAAACMQSKSGMLLSLV